MFTQAEMDQQARDTAEMGVIDLIDSDFEGDAFAEVLEIAIEIAIDEFDAETDGEGWKDCTNYAYAAQAAGEQWLDAQQAMYEAMQDDRAHAAADRAAGL